MLSLLNSLYPSPKFSTFHPFDSLLNITWGGVSEQLPGAMLLTGLKHDISASYLFFRIRLCFLIFSISPENLCLLVMHSLIEKR